MGSSASCETDDVSCSSAFATCRTQHCTSSCIKAAQEVERTLAPLEIIAQNAVKKYVEDNLHIILQDHLPAALATHLETVANGVIESINVVPVTPVSPVTPVTPDAVAIDEIPE